MRVRELLQRDVHEAVDRTVRIGHLSARHLRHPSVLEGARVERSGDGHEVAQRDRVPSLLGRPPVRPLAPCALAAEHPVDRLEVVREVVLGEEVDEQRAADRIGHRHLTGVPVLTLDEVAAQAPRHELVRVPRLAGLVVASGELLGHRGQFVQELDLVHDPSVYLPVGRRCVQDRPHGVPVVADERPAPASLRHQLPQPVPDLQPAYTRAGDET